MPYPTMSDKDMLSDVLTSQKQASEKYNTFAYECRCPNLKQTCLNLLVEEQQIATEVFTEMNTRGWYPVKDATQQEVNETKQTFQTPAMQG